MRSPMNLTCTYCDRAFTASRRRKCCSHACAHAMRSISRGTAPWEKDADIWLELKAGTLPMPLLLAAFHRAQRRQGWHPRTDYAIENRMRTLNLSRTCTENNIAKRELARVLGMNSMRPNGWIRRGLPCRVIGSRRHCIRVRDLRQWLLENPHEAYNVDMFGLETMIGADAARSIAAAEHQRRGFRRAVVCLDTGRRFDSLGAAARAYGVTHGAISKAIANGGRSAGYRWAWLDELRSRAG